MIREDAFARCPSDSYVEFYANQWLIIPFAPVTQPHFIVRTPGPRIAHAEKFSGHVWAPHPPDEPPLVVTDGTTHGEPKPWSGQRR